MSVGTLARKLLGKRFHSVAKRYRAVFVSLDAVAKTVSKYLPEGALVLDVGGGDGAPLNHLLNGRPDLRIIMLDVASSVGNAVEERFANRVSRQARTELAEYDGARPDAILLMDVVHHVPQPERHAFFRDLGALLDRHKVGRVIVKDVARGGIRSWVALMADRYISGDRQVHFYSIEELRRTLEQFGPVHETELYSLDAPNYCSGFGCHLER